MIRRGKRVWRTAALALALLWVASPSWAAPRLWQGGPMSAWEALWEGALTWLGGQASIGAPAGRTGNQKSSSQIDPLGLTAPASGSQADYSSSIDPNGRQYSSAGIDPDGSH